MSNSKITSVWILGDQLLRDHPALIRAEEVSEQQNVRVVLIESTRRKTRLPYQRKKLVLLLSAMRHYADELRSMGYTVDYVQAETMVDGLRQHVQEHRPQRLITMAAAEYGGRAFQKNRLGALFRLTVEVIANTQFLVGRFDPFADREPGTATVMEHFYRDMRRHFNVLLRDSDEPVGGAWNFDKENRKPYPKREGLEAPAPVSFEPDEITQAVMAQVAADDHGVGTVNGFDLAVTRAQAEEALNDFIATRFHHFGAYEDAMSQEHRTLYHSVLSPYINIGLLDPLEIVRRAEEAYENDIAPINSVEGFVRQILGWREYIYWQYWAQMPDLLTANEWEHNRPMPQMFWDGETEMNCIRTVAGRVIEHGFSHHIERLMIVCNFCMLTGIDPAAVNEWFLVFYIDAYEWVVTPNVIGMGLNADGGKTATKPYTSSANYINKMGDFCTGCRYNHKERTGEDACPFNYLYWNFLIKHEETLRANPRSGRAVLGLRHLDEEERDAVKEQAETFIKELPLYE